MIKLPSVLLRPALFVAGAAIAIGGCQPTTTPVEESAPEASEETTTETTTEETTETVFARCYTKR